jgi:cation transport ATPase
VNESNAHAITVELDGLPCVDGVSLNRTKETLKIAYDASHHNIDEMIAIVEKHGAAIKDSWFSRTRLGWQRQTDGNIKDNARHEAHCCNKMPPR